jgi:hypothetical protein
LFDNLVDKADFVVSLVFVSDVSFSLPSADGDGVVVVRGGLEVDFPSLVFGGLGSLESDEHFVDVGLGSGFLSLEVLELSLGVLEPDSKVPTGLDFRSFEIFDGSVEVLFEGVEQVVDLVFNGSSGGDFGFFFFLVISKLVESLEGLFVEKVLVGLEFGEGVLFDFEEFFGGSLSVDGGEKVVSEESDGLDGVVVFLEGSDEDLGRVASLVLEFGFSSGDVSSSGVDPLDVGAGGGDFVLDVLAVGGGSVSGGLVNLGNVEEVGDFVVTVGLVGHVFSVLLGLGVLVGLTEVIENLDGGVGGVGSLGG